MHLPFLFNAAAASVCVSRESYGWATFFILSALYRLAEFVLEETDNC